MPLFSSARHRPANSVQTGVRTGAVTAASLALVLALPGVAMAAPGDLDTTFGTGGQVLTPDFGRGDSARDMAVQPDGKIVVVGTTGTGNDDGDFAVARYNADGSLDTGFGGDGTVSTDFQGAEDQANAVAVQGDGKILVTGHGRIEGAGQFFTVLRYNADGSLDTAFADGGVLVPQWANGQDSGMALKVLPNGQFLAAGTSIGQFVVGRFTADGNSDASFGTFLGSNLHGFPGGGPSFMEDITLQDDGKIVAAGLFDSTNAGNLDFALARYTADGILDTTFDTDGMVVTDFGGSDAARGVGVQTDGRIVAAGSTGGDIALARYNTNGARDTAFDTDGLVTTSLGGTESSWDMELQSDSRIVLTGAAAGNFLVARYNTNGSLDTGFSGDGVVTTDFGGADEGRGVKLQSDGKIVAAGTGGPGIDFALARYEGGGGSVPPPPPPPAEGDVSVAKSGPATVSIGDQAAYTVTVTNNSTEPATGVTLSDHVTGASPTLLSATPSQGTCTTTPTSAACALGTLAPGTSATVVVVVEPRTTGTLTNTAAVDATETDADTSNNSTTFTTTVNNARGCAIVGTSGNDTLVGTSGNNVICGLSGNDTVYAGPGNDVVSGGSGSDTLIAGPGADSLDGGSGNDTLNTVDGVNGNDRAVGGSGFDRCSTDPGDIRSSC